MNNFLKNSVFAVASIALSFAAIEAKPAHATNLIQNGSFEIGVSPGTYLPLGVGSTDIQAWTVVRGSIDYYGTGWISADGSRSLDLNGTPGVGGVAQKFTTTPGQQYKVNFAFAGHPSGLLQTMRVSAAGKSQDFSFQAGTNEKNLGWKDIEWLFTAIDTETTLEFYSLQTFYEFGGPALDNVRVSAISVPEHSSVISLFAFGCVSSSFLIRRKLRKLSK